MLDNKHDNWKMQFLLIVTKGSTYFSLCEWDLNDISSHVCDTIFYLIRIGYELT